MEDFAISFPKFAVKLGGPQRVNITFALFLINLKLEDFAISFLKLIVSLGGSKSLI